MVLIFSILSFVELYTGGCALSSGIVFLVFFIDKGAGSLANTTTLSLLIATGAINHLCDILISDYTSEEGYDLVKSLSPGQAPFSVGDYGLRNTIDYLLATVSPDHLKKLLALWN
ncbi:hypothetical protein [Coxiella endosymbiont of Ornithodoros maritimus]|uniref:hypothetical protein n=1 Tax=Coxiella endosymbiont of Ornithodoros maritimus TaxID=1656172 RepID=UPI002B3FFE22|nr:hypothetical protein [Coxiella endosymbiont of Ornithodoros maritimus]